MDVYISRLLSIRCKQIQIYLLPRDYFYKIMTFNYDQYIHHILFLKFDGETQVCCAKTLSSNVACHLKKRLFAIQNIDRDKSNKRPCYLSQFSVLVHCLLTVSFQRMTIN